MKKIYSFTFAMLSLIGMSNAQTGTWTPISAGTSSNLLGVYAPSASVVYVCGASGLIKKSTDAGATWVTQTSSTSQDLYDIAFSDEDNGIVVGNNATVRRTIDGGISWTTVSITSSQHFRGIVYTSPTVAYASSGTSSGLLGDIWRTTDGGSSWSPLPVSAASDAIYQVFFVGASQGYAVDYDGNIIKTINGGTSWSGLSSGVTSPLSFVHFTSSTNGVAGGGNGVLRRTSDGGTTWVPVTTGTADNIGSIDFTNANHGVIVGGNVGANTGTMLTTNDGGASWNVSYPGTTRLYNIDFFNVNLGYAVGLNGAILKYTNTVGIDDIEGVLSTLNSYPNPFNESTTIDCSNFKFDANPTVKIYDVTGKVVRDFTSSDKKQIFIEKGELNAGMYFYKVLDGNKMIGTGKMIVK